MALRNDQTSLLGKDEEQNWPAGRQPHPPAMDQVSPHQTPNRVPHPPSGLQLGPHTHTHTRHFPTTLLGLALTSRSSWLRTVMEEKEGGDGMKGGTLC